MSATRVCYKQYISVLSGVLAVAPLFAQEGSMEIPTPCAIEPIFHCAESMDDGSYIGHFGYRTSCPEMEKPVEDVFIQIGEDNYFAPGSIDRGQPKIFLVGEHVDEFEVEFTAEEINTGKEFVWSVLKVEAVVDFSRTKDAFLDCSSPP